MSKEEDWEGVKHENKEEGMKIYVKFRWGLEEAKDPAELQK